MSLARTLRWTECELAAYAGMKRQLLAIHDGRHHRYGFKGDPWQAHIEACGAELAVARVLGQFWTAWARRPSEVVADVGSNVQVRRSGHEGGDLRLITHPDDRDDHVFVLVTGSLPDFQLVGWATGAEAKQDRYWGDPFGTGRPAFWMPAADLHPIDALLEAAAA